MTKKKIVEGTHNRKLKGKEVCEGPAGKKDTFSVTYTSFMANKERTEIQVADGKEFDNDALLELLGFEKDEKGALRLPTSEYECEIADNGEIIRRKVGTKILTENNNAVEER